MLLISIVAIVRMNNNYYRYNVDYFEAKNFQRNEPKCQLLMMCAFTLQFSIFLHY